MGLFSAAFRFFLTWWGAYLLAALDASMVFFLPFGIDAFCVENCATTPVSVTCTPVAWIPRG